MFGTADYGFSWGNNFAPTSIFGNNLVQSNRTATAVPYTGVTPTPTDDSGLPGWLSTLLGTGLSTYRTYLANDLANEQVARNMSPSVVPTASGTTVLGNSVTGLTSTLAGLLPLIIIVGIILFILRGMLGGGRRR